MIIIIKPGNYEPELEGTCPRCGQVEGLEQSECGVFAGVFHKSCSLCGCALKIEKKLKSESIDRPSEDEIWAQTQVAMAEGVKIGGHLLATFDIRRKK